MTIGFGAISRFRRFAVEPLFGVSPVPASIGAMALLLSACSAGDRRYWAECRNSQNGETVQVVDNFIGNPRVRDKSGFEFDLKPGRDGWRCKRDAGQAPR
jgi:hypothetical protein